LDQSAGIRLDGPGVGQNLGLCLTKGQANYAVVPGLNHMKGGQSAVRDVDGAASSNDIAALNACDTACSRSASSFSSGLRGATWPIRVDRRYGLDTAAAEQIRPTFGMRGHRRRCRCWRRWRGHCDRLRHRDRCDLSRFFAASKRVIHGIVQLAGLVMAVIALAAAPQTACGQDVAAGEAVFKKWCLPCHAVGEGAKIAAGSVVVRAEPVPSGIEIEIADSGDGIAPEERDRVFTAFYRGGFDAARTGDGAGLGLAVSRAIVEAHGGRIWLADSTDGTSVRFSLLAA